MSAVNHQRTAYAALLVAFSVALIGAAHAADSASAADARSAQTSESLFPRLPDEGNETRLPNSQFNFLRGSPGAGGGSGGAGSAVSEATGARVLDQLDRRRNWIYATQTPSSFELSAQQAMGVRGAEADRAGESEGWLAEFFSDRGAQNTKTRSIDDLFSSSLDSPRVGSALFGGMPHVTAIPQLNSGLGLTAFQPSTATSPGVSTSSSVGQSLREQQGLSSIPTSVRDLLGYSENSTSSDFDPINLRTDTTRQELNPTVSERMADLNITPKTVDALLERPLREASSTRSSILDNFNNRMTGGSSLTPAAQAPSVLPAQERSLDFGRFPSRKF